ncbi:outer membrane beta-barrel protein [Bacteroidota bacterium]
MKRLFILLLLFSSFSAFSQSNTIEGDIFNEKGEAIGVATAVLLNRADSTLEYYAISNMEGHYGITGIKNGEYLMQFAFLGYKTQYKVVKIPLETGTKMETVVLEVNPVNIGEAVVTGDRVPIRIKKDTIEFNADAFKTKPDAVVEELLKKLPGFEVDRAGNIKALGEKVTKVLVDGKEFFGSDPKVATRNLPADAIDKVQVYDKKSDESEFTGVSDGSRNKTVNLVLDEDKKKGIFGNILAGGGTDKHYLASGKMYKFNDKHQIAIMGMQNNISQTGFSINDYLDFSGGISGLMSGGGLQIGGDGIPLNMGGQGNGLTTSGGGGANFSRSWSKNQRIFASYLLSGSNTNLEQNTSTRNFTDNGSFLQEDELNQNKRDTTHRINFGMRNMIDSTHNIIVNGNISLSSGYIKKDIFTNSLINDTLFNSLNRNNLDHSNNLSGNISGSFLKKINPKRTIFKLAASATYSKGLTESEFNNITNYYYPETQINSDQYLDNLNKSLNLTASTSLTQKIGKLYYIVPQIKAGRLNQTLDRTQGIRYPNDAIIDSLSPNFTKTYEYLKPEISFKRNTKRSSFTIALMAELGRMNTSFKEDPSQQNDYFYFTPWLNWDFEYQTARRISVDYRSRINTPSLNQLLPVVNNINPLSHVLGNPDLKPEYNHNLRASWYLFDRFSFTSVMVRATFNYTMDKINWIRDIDDQLRQKLTLKNVGDDYRADGYFNFSTDIKPLGIKISTNINEGWNQGISIINDVENINTNLSHSLTFSIDNRKKNKWDLKTGISLSLTDAKYSIQDYLNNRYFNWSYFTEIRYNPDEKWNFQVSADVVKYDASSFEESISIPLIAAEASYYFLKNNRGVLTLQASDLLNKNTGISRVSEMNYLKESRSNVIGRFIILSFKFRLNKMGGNNEGVIITTSSRR